jgi:hypothetical protein
LVPDFINPAMNQDFIVLDPEFTAGDGDSNALEKFLDNWRPSVDHGVYEKKRDNKNAHVQANQLDLGA